MKQSLPRIYAFAIFASATVNSSVVLPCRFDVEEADVNWRNPDHVYVDDRFYVSLDFSLLLVLLRGVE